MEKYAEIFTDCNGISRQVVWWRIKGSRPGPVLSLIAGQHGMEHVGPGLLPEFCDEIRNTDFAGELRICPNANPFALAIDYEFYPEHEDLSKINDYYYSVFRHNYCPWGLGRGDSRSYYNMNRTWNMEEPEGVAAKITRWLWSDMISGSDMVIDMHCHQYATIVFELETIFDPVLSAIPGIDTILITSAPQNEWSGGTLTWQANKHGIKALCFEFSVQHARGEHDFENGKRYIRNLMAGCRMLDADIVHENAVRSIPKLDFADGIINAACEGRIRFFKKEYEFVRKDELIFVIRSLESGEIIQEGRAAYDGIVWRPTPNVIVKPGIRCAAVRFADLLLEAGTPAKKLPENWWIQKEK